jgi:uncharacterized membrane protein YgcG
MSFFSAIIAYSGAYLFLVFIAVCLATGLYYLAEMVEEHTRLTKRVLQWSIKISVGVNVLLLIVDGMPFSCVAVSLAALGCYQTLLKRFPFIEATSPEFIGSALFLVANHVMWLRHFRGDAYEYEHHTLEYHLGFFLMIVWIVPFGFFISLAANESILPSGGLAGSGGSGILNATGGTGMGSGVGGMNGGGMSGPGGGFDDPRRGRKRHRNMVLQLMNFGKAQWEKVAKKSFPNGMPQSDYVERHYA